MTKFQLIARIIFIIVGVRILVLLMNYLSFAFVAHREFSNPYRAILTLGLFTLCMLLIVYCLIFRSDKLIAKVTGYIDENEPIVSGLWVAAGIRAVMFFCGVVIIAHNIDFICNFLSFILQIPGMVLRMEILDGWFFNSLFYPYGRNPAYYFEVFLGIYLIFGAPVVIRLLMKRYGYRRSLG